MKANNKIVIFYAWGRKNAGDHALILGALELLSEIIPQRDIVVVSRFHAPEDPICPIRDIQKRFPAVVVVASPFDLTLKSGAARIHQLLACSIKSLFAIACPRFFLRKAEPNTFWYELGSAKLVLLNGGNLLFWHKIRKNLGRLLAIMLPLALARRLRIPYGMLPQTCGPFEGVIPTLIGKCFSHAAFLTFRDSTSMQHASHLVDLREIRHKLLPDLAFFLTRKPECGVAAPPVTSEGQERTFGVCLRIDPLGLDVKQEHDDPQKTQKRILDLLPSAIAQFQSETSVHCTIIVQVDGDRQVSHLLLHELRRLDVKCSLIELTDPYEFVEFYTRLDFLVSFRLHSMIFALSQGTPVLGIWRKPLGTKIPSMMHDLDLDDYCSELDELDGARLLKQMLALHNNQHQLKKRIKNRIQEGKNTAISFFKEFL